MKVRPPLVVGVILCIALSALIVFAPSLYRQYFPQQATVASMPTIKVFLDSGCTQEVLNGTTINWGTVSSGANIKNYWIKNVGNCGVTLSLQTSNVPAGWSLQWDYDGSSIAVNSIRQVKITLTVPSGATAGTYTWKAWIEAQGI